MKACDTTIPKIQYFKLHISEKSIYKKNELVCFLQNTVKESLFVGTIFPNEKQNFPYICMMDL